MSKLMVVFAFVFSLTTVQPHTAAQGAEAASPVSEWAVPPPNTPVIGPCSGTTVDYRQDDFTQTPAPPPFCAEQLEALQAEAQATTTSAEVPAQGAAQVLTAVETRKPGNLVADGRKMTLYTLVATGEGKLRFGLAARESDLQRRALPCAGECLETWSPLTLENSAALTGEGLDRALDPALIGRIPRDDGTVQVTYNGYPLFHFSGDTAPGQKKGLGREDFGGRWYMVSSSSGALLEANVANR